MGTPDFASLDAVLLPSILGEPLFQVIGHLVPGVNDRPSLYLTIEVCFERLAVAIFVKFDADSENTSMTAGCEPRRLARILVEPFAHSGHFSGEIGRGYPNYDRAHVHPPRFLKSV